MLLAQSLKEEIEKSARQTGETGAGFAKANVETLPYIVAKFIGGALAVVGILFVSLLIYAGFLWMTAAGNEDKVTKAKKLLIEAVIGLAIVLTAYAITNFVVSGLANATGISQ